MDDGGYTLVETLVVLAILGLSMSGLYAGVQVLAGQQRAIQTRVVAAERQRQVETSLERLFEGRGPFRSHEPQALSGDVEGFRFDCGALEPCAVRLQTAGAGLSLVVREGEAERTLPLAGRAPAALSYDSDNATDSTWPPGRAARERLRRIRVVDADARSVVVARLWREQAAACAFDPILQDCR